MNPYEVRNNFQMWRCFTALFLTTGFQQWAFSSAYLLLFGFMFTSTGMKSWKMLLFYLVCGATGNIFGAACDKHGAIFVGCIPACYGMFSSMIATVIVNWKVLGPLKTPLALTLTIFTICLMLNSSSNLNIFNNYHPHSVWSSWGGFIMGLCLGLIVMPRAGEGRAFAPWSKLC
jgi:membrane associated rhomboid family serine protease